MRILISTVIVIAVFLVSPGDVFAAGADPTGGLPHKGSHALQFQIDESFTLTSFQGSMISYMKFLRNRTALRIGISVSGYLSEEEQIREYPNSDSLGLREADSNSWSHNFTLLGQLLRYKRRGLIWLYYGGGPKIVYANRHNDSYDYRRYGDELTKVYSDFKLLSWSIGSSGVVGVQKLFGDYVALHAEYAFSIMYRWTSSTSESKRAGSPDQDMKITRDSSSLYVSSDGVRFGLSVYF